MFGPWMIVKKQIRQRPNQGKWVKSEGKGKKANSQASLFGSHYDMLGEEVELVSRAH